METKDLLGVEDGPSVALLRYMEDGWFSPCLKNNKNNKNNNNSNNNNNNTNNNSNNNCNNNQNNQNNNRSIYIYIHTRKQW